MKAMRFSSGFKDKQLFQNGPPTTGGTAMPNQEGAEPQTSEATDVQHRIRSLSGTNEHNTNNQNFLIIDFKSMLLNHFACQGIHHPCMVTHAPVLQPGFYSNLFLIPKKDGGQHLVINLKVLNRFVQKEHFKMEGIHTVKDLLRQGDWLAKVDLNDAFFEYR